jgi:predicted DNA-binding transcriptional regulator YafY
VASATLQRRKLWREYHARSTDEVTERTVSLQRIVPWYLDAWDEGKDALRSFSIDRIRRATVLDESALDVPEAELDDHYSTAYVIFGGKADKIAVLRFTPERARWVADEQWHPQQNAKWLQDGFYELAIPYRESRELAMDVMRLGSSVEVIAPTELRELIAKALRSAALSYVQVDS